MFQNLLYVSRSNFQGILRLKCHSSGGGGGGVKLLFEGFFFFFGGGGGIFIHSMF